MVFFQRVVFKKSTCRRSKQFICVLINQHVIKGSYALKSREYRKGLLCLKYITNSTEDMLVLL